MYRINRTGGVGVFTLVQHSGGKMGGDGQSYKTRVGSNQGNVTTASPCTGVLSEPFPVSVEGSSESLCSIWLDGNGW